MYLVFFFSFPQSTFWVIELMGGGIRVANLSKKAGRETWKMLRMNSACIVITSFTLSHFIWSIFSIYREFCPSTPIYEYCLNYFQFIKDEHDALRITYASIEDKRLKLEKENRELIARLIEMKSEDADRLNAETEMIMRFVNDFILYSWFKYGILFKFDYLI